MNHQDWVNSIPYWHVFNLRIRLENRFNGLKEFAVLGIDVDIARANEAERQIGILKKLEDHDLYDEDEKKQYHAAWKFLMSI